MANTYPHPQPAFPFRALRMRNPVGPGIAQAITLLLAGAISLANAPAHAAKPSEGAPAFAAILEREVPALMQSANIKGAAFGLIADGQLVYAKGFGFADHAGTAPVTPNTVFVSASLTKPVAARVTMALVAQGKLALDQPVADGLNPWPLAPSVFDHRSITLRHLLTHTAGTTLGGYQGWTDFKELPTLEESLAGKTNGRGPVELFAAAGSKFHYSGGGYTLMQLALERSTGRTYADLAAELVFRPLGMAHSSVAMTPQILAHAAQGHGDEGQPVPMRYYVEQAPSTLTTTVNDFARWMVAGMWGADGAPQRPWTHAQLAAMYTPATLSTPRAPGEAQYGMGHFIERLGDGSTAVGHDGRNQAGFRANFLMRPQQRDGIVFFSNSRSGLALDHVVCLWRAQVSGAQAAAVCKKP